MRRSGVVFALFWCVVSCSPAPPPIVEPIELSAGDARIARSGWQWASAVGGLLPLLSVPHSYPNEAFLEASFEAHLSGLRTLYQDVLDGLDKGCATLSPLDKHKFTMTLKECKSGSGQAPSVSGVVSLSFALDAAELQVMTRWSTEGLKVGEVEIKGSFTASASLYRHGLVLLSVDEGASVAHDGESIGLKQFEAEISRSDKDGEGLYSMVASGGLSVGDTMLTVGISSWQQRVGDGSPFYGLLALHRGAGGERHVVELLFLEQTPKAGVVEVQVDGRKAGQKTSMDLKK